MPEYKSIVPLPERVSELMQLLSEQGVPRDLSYDENQGRWTVTLSYSAADLWEAAEAMTGIALDDRYSRAWEGESIEFIAKPTEVAPRTERVYMTEAAAMSAAAERELEELERSTRQYLPNDDENLREHTEHNQRKLSMTLDLPASPALTRGTDPAARVNQEWIRRDIRAAIESGALPVQVGDPATVFVGSDRYPYTITDVVPFKSGPRQGKPRVVHAKLDNAKWDELGGVYTFFPVDDRTATVFTATDELGLFKSRAGTLLRVGRRSYYQAPEV
jgi:hypothetical protein